MDIAIFEKLAKEAAKVKWSNTATLDGRQVAVTDVDLKGRVSLNAPLTASVKFTDAGKARTITGVFWPHDLRPEGVDIDGVAQPNGHVSLAGKASVFPPGAKLKLRFRFSSTATGTHEFLVTGKAGVSALF